MSSASNTNIFDENKSFIHLGQFSAPFISDKIMGRFPVESFHPCFLEIPKKSLKKDLSGRKNFLIANRTKKNSSWVNRRIIELPIYNLDDYKLSEYDWRNIFYSWYSSSNLEEIPCISLVSEISGFYSVLRESQQITALLIWPDHCRILELDWFEGPEDDCITPEWYICSNKIMSLTKAVNKVSSLYKNEPDWNNIVYSIFLNPFQLGESLSGSKLSTEIEPWAYKWNYLIKSNFRHDLEEIFDRICTIIS